MICCLYRHFNKDGVLLYVGATSNALLRIDQHRSTAPWYGEISRVEIEHFATRREAIHAEEVAIEKELPLHNKQKYKPRADKVVRDVVDWEFQSGVDVDAVSRKTIQNVLKEKCLQRSQKEVANQLGVAVATINEALKDRREFGPKLLDALGYERVVVYVKTWRK